MSRPPHPLTMIGRGPVDPALERCRNCGRIVSACDAGKDVRGVDCCDGCTHDPA